MLGSSTRSSLPTESKPRMFLSTGLARISLSSLRVKVSCISETECADIRNGEDEARDHHAAEGNVEEPRDVGNQHGEHLRQHHGGEVDARDGKARVAPCKVGVFGVEDVQGEESDLCGELGCGG